MFSQLLSRLIILVLGNLYPAYASFKAVKSKNAREYARWMMYWIVFALFVVIETFTDIFLSWFPFYYELKIAFVIWLLLPTFKGSSFIYRKLLHPYLVKNEQDIDLYIERSKELGSQALVTLGKQSVEVAQRTLAQKGPVWRSVSAQYLDQIVSQRDIDYADDDQTDASRSVLVKDSGDDATSSRRGAHNAGHRPDSGNKHHPSNIRHRTNSHASKSAANRLSIINDEDSSDRDLKSSPRCVSRSSHSPSRMTFPLSNLEQDDINSSAASSFTFLPATPKSVVKPDSDNSRWRTETNLSSNASSYDFSSGSHAEYYTSHSPGRFFTRKVDNTKGKFESQLMCPPSHSQNPPHSDDETTHGNEEFVHVSDSLPSSTNHNSNLSDTRFQQPSHQFSNKNPSSLSSDVKLQNQQHLFCNGYMTDDNSVLPDHLHITHGFKSTPSANRHNTAAIPPAVSGKTAAAEIYIKKRTQPIVTRNITNSRPGKRL